MRKFTLVLSSVVFLILFFAPIKAQENLTFNLPTAGDAVRGFQIYLPNKIPKLRAEFANQKYSSFRRTIGHRFYPRHAFQNR